MLIIIGMKKGLTFFGPDFQHQFVGFLDREQAAKAAAHYDTDSRRDLGLYLEFGVFHRIVGGPERKLEKRVHFPEFFFADELLRMKVFDLSGDMGRKSGRIEAGDRPDS